MSADLGEYVPPGYDDCESCPVCGQPGPGSYEWFEDDAEADTPSGGER